MFSTYKGGSAYLNLKEISVSSNTNLSQSLLATGFPYYQFEKQPQYIQLFTDMMQKCHGLRRIGSAAVDLAYVACGRYDGFYEYNLNPWDVAAGALIVQQAGGKTSDFKGGSDYLFSREIVATKAAIQITTHAAKIPAFLFAGFEYGEHVGLLGPLVLAAVVGTLVGGRVLERLSPVVFRRLFATVLVAVALHLIFSA